MTHSGTTLNHYLSWLNMVIIGGGGGDLFQTSQNPYQKPATVYLRYLSMYVKFHMTIGSKIDSNRPVISESLNRLLEYYKFNGSKIPLIKPQIWKVTKWPKKKLTQFIAYYTCTMKALVKFKKNTEGTLEANKHFIYRKSL